MPDNERILAEAQVNVPGPDPPAAGRHSRRPHLPRHARRNAQRAAASEGPTLAEQIYAADQQRAVETTPSGPSLAEQIYAAEQQRTAETPAGATLAEQIYAAEQRATEAEDAQRPRSIYDYPEEPAGPSVAEQIYAEQQRQGEAGASSRANRARSGSADYASDPTGPSIAEQIYAAEQRVEVANARQRARFEADIEALRRAYLADVPLDERSREPTSQSVAEQIFAAQQNEDEEVIRRRQARARAANADQHTEDLRVRESNAEETEGDPRARSPDVEPLDAERHPRLNAELQDAELRAGPPRPSQYHRHGSDSTPTGQLWQQFLIKLLLIVAILVAVFRLVMGIQIQHGNRMHPFLLDGDLLVTYKLDGYRVGDVVAYRRPDTGEMGVSRIIAIGPSEIRITESGEVLVDGSVQTSAVYPTAPLAGSIQTYPYQVSANGYYLLDDNRPAGSDSRAFGELRRWELLGKVVYVFRRRGI